MTKVYKRTSLVVTTVKRLRHGCQRKAFLDKEWPIKISPEEVKSKQEVALQAKLETASIKKDELVKENAALKKMSETLKGQVTYLANQVQKAQSSGFQPSQGRSRVKSPSQCTKCHQRGLKRKFVGLAGG